MPDEAGYCIVFESLQTGERGILCHDAYSAFVDDCERRVKRGEKQCFCHTCGRWHWPDQVKVKCVMVPAGMCLLCGKRRPKRDVMLCRLCDPPGPSPCERAYQKAVREAAKRGEFDDA